jgi:hypothetical protein
LALPLVASTQIAQPEPQLKPQCETASLKISKAALGAEDVMRGQCMEDRQGRMTVEDTRRAQAESDRAARFGAEDVMYGRYGDQTSRSIWRSRSYAYWF